jgi:tRNA dimethylallyltransferase
MKPSGSRLLSPIPLVVIVGPTASGKSSLALRVAESIGGEIVACDALQVRAGLPLLTAKPTEAELLRIPHHLIGVFAADEPATAARYAELADAAISDIHSRGRRVVLCGGTGLYLRALCEGLVATPSGHPEFRNQLRSEAESLGTAALHQRLQAIDPESAARIAPADYVRIERALEVHALTGRTMTDWHREHQKERTQGPRYETLRIGLDPGPDKLRQRILLRTQGWLAHGLREEVAAFDAAFGPMRFPPLGYEQVLRHITGPETERIDEESLIRELCQKTAQYARRQRIWFRSEPGITWFPDVSEVPITITSQPQPSL